MPYKNKQDYLNHLQEKRLNYKSTASPKQCPVCSKEFFLVKGRTKASACIDCYKQYRSLYNLLAAAKFRSTKKNLEYDLDINWAIKQSKICPKTGFPLSYLDNGKDFSIRSPYAASIDKVDPSQGYTKSNCQIVCWWYNVSKQTFTDKQVEKLCRAVVNTLDIVNARGA
jgi:hypothetical protein